MTHSDQPLIINIDLGRYGESWVVDDERQLKAALEDIADKPMGFVLMLEYKRNDDVPR